MRETELQIRRLFLQMKAIKAHAKLNLFLDVRHTRKDGLHDIVAVNHEVAFDDILTFDFAADGIQFTIEGNSDIPADESNLVMKAIRALEQQAVIPGMAIKLCKNIPAGAGLGGGSADAAAVMRFLNEQLALGLTESQLLETGTKLGADVPFALKGGTALVTGAGEHLRQLQDPPEPLWFVIGNPGISVNTGEAYRWLDEADERSPVEVNGMLSALESGDLDRLAASFHNSFQLVIFEKYPQIGKLRDAIINAGATGSAMTGSGSNVFGLVRDRSHGQEIIERLNEDRWNLSLVCSTRP